MADDGEDVGGWNYLYCGSYDMGQQRLAADFMKHFRKLRFEASAFSGGHDGDGHTRGHCGFVRRNCFPGFLHFFNYTLTGDEAKASCAKRQMVDFLGGSE
jgi:hypothetical protein